MLLAVPFFAGERLLRRRRNPLLRGLLDSLFCLTCMLMLMVICLTKNGGQLRWFQPAGMILGMSFYRRGPLEWLRRLKGRGSRRKNARKSGIFPDKG